MKLTMGQLKKLIREEVRGERHREEPPPAGVPMRETEWDSPSGAAQMSSPEQRDPGKGGPIDAARLLSGILDDWMNEPDMNHSVGDQFFDRVEKVMIMLQESSA